MLDRKQIPNGKAPCAGHTKGLLKDAKQATYTVDFTPSSQLASGEFALLAAQFAALGHSLHQSPTCAVFMVTRWGMLRYLTNVHEAKYFLTLIGGKP